MKSDLVIYDGSNFYHGAKRAFPGLHLTDFNYCKLARITSGDKDPMVEYCVGEIRYNQNKKVLRLYSNQQKLFDNLESRGVIIKKGFMLKSDGRYHEKGVDVQIAVDILRGALKNEYHRCFLVSSDTDLVPAILDARAAKKQIIYVGFKDRPSNALQAVCARTIFFTRTMISRCASKKS